MTAVQVVASAAELLRKLENALRDSLAGLPLAPSGGLPDWTSRDAANPQANPQANPRSGGAAGGGLGPDGAAGGAAGGAAPRVLLGLLEYTAGLRRELRAAQVAAGKAQV